jgi:ABC-type phosphate transport system permease subunit
MSAVPAPPFPEFLLATLLALLTSVAVAVGVALLLQEARPVLGGLIRRLLQLAAAVPPVLVAAAVLSAIASAGLTPSSGWLPLLPAAIVVPMLTMQCDRIFREITPPLRDAAAALGAGSLSITLTLVLPATLAAVAGAALATGAQGLGAVLTLGILQEATGVTSVPARPSPLGEPVGLMPLVLIAAAATLTVSTLVGIYIEDFAEGSRWTRHVDRVISWLAALPPLVYALLLVVLVGTVRQTPPDAGTAALLFALLLGPHAALAVRSALATVPASLREASRALGASRRQTLRHLVLPAAARPLLRHLSGAVARASVEWLPLLAIGVALGHPWALPSWIPGLDARWMTVPGVAAAELISPAGPGLRGIPSVIWLLLGLPLVAAWLTSPPGAGRAGRS